MKYRPDFPARFDSIQAARAHCQAFFAWHNDAHRHTGLGLHTPAGVRDLAYTAHPERFVRKPPEPPKLPAGSWINKPDDTEEAAQ